MGSAHCTPSALPSNTSLTHSLCSPGPAQLYGVHPDQLPTTLRAELLNALAVHPTPAQVGRRRALLSAGWSALLLTGQLSLPRYKHHAVARAHSAVGTSRTLALPRVYPSPSLPPSQAAIRSGCVHLTLTALIDAEERQRLLAPGAAATVLTRLLLLVERLPARRAALQLGQGSGGSAALLATPARGSDGPAALLSLQLGNSGASPLPPVLEVQPPLATTVSACRGFFRMRCPRGLLWGADGLMALCRRAGTGHVPLSLTLAGQQWGKQPPPGAAADEGEEDLAASDDEELSHGEEAADAAAEAADAGVEAADAAAECDPEELVDVDAWVPFQPPPAEEQQSDMPIWQAGWGLYEFELARGELLRQVVPPG